MILQWISKKLVLNLWRKNLPRFVNRDSLSQAAVETSKQNARPELRWTELRWTEESSVDRECLENWQEMQDFHQKKKLDTLWRMFLIGFNMRCQHVRSSRLEYLSNELGFLMEVNNKTLLSDSSIWLYQMRCNSSKLCRFCKFLRHGRQWLRNFHRNLWFQNAAP